MEYRFDDTLKRDHQEAVEGEKMEEALSEVEEAMDTRVTPAGTTTAKAYRPGTTPELVQVLSDDEWAKTTTSLWGSPRKSLKL